MSQLCTSYYTRRRFCFPHLVQHGHGRVTSRGHQTQHSTLQTPTVRASSRHEPCYQHSRPLVSLQGHCQARLRALDHPRSYHSWTVLVDVSALAATFENKVATANVIEPLTLGCVHGRATNRVIKRRRLRHRFFVHHDTPAPHALNNSMQQPREQALK